jgi:nitrite reductase/ring-hydroxylating ferredoxin subunit
MAAKTTKHKIALSIDDLLFLPNGIAELTVNGKAICIAQQNEQLFAFAAKCPHASGKMADGYIDALGNVVCPLHRYKFSMETGRNTSGEGFYLKTYPVEQSEKGIFVLMEEKGLFGW